MVIGVNIYPADDVNVILIQLPVVCLDMTQHSLCSAYEYEMKNVSISLHVSVVTVSVIPPHCGLFSPLYWNSTCRTRLHLVPDFASD